MKRIVSIVLICLIIACPFYTVAQDTGNDTGDPDMEQAAEVEIPAVLSLAEAREIALKNNKQTIIDDLEIKSKEKALETAKENAAMASDAFGPESVLNNRIRKEVRVKEAEANLETARRKKQDNIEKLKLNISSTFNNILLAQKELEKELRKLEIAEEKYEIAKRKYNIRSISEDTLSNIEYEVISRSLSVESAKEKLKSLDIRLKDLLGLDLDGPELVINGEINMADFEELDIDLLVAETIDSDTGVFSAAGKYNVAKRIMELTEELIKPDTEIYIGNKINLETALRDYIAAKRNREVDIRNSYNDLLNLRDNVDLALRYEELQKRKLENAKTRYEAGKITKEEYLQAEESFIDAVYNKYRAICDFNIKYENFLTMIKAK